MNALDSAALDRHITGNYGEDQFLDHDDYDGPCQLTGCDEPTVDGVLCTDHDAARQAAEDRTDN